MWAGVETTSQLSDCLLVYTKCQSSFIYCFHPLKTEPDSPFIVILFLFSCILVIMNASRLRKTSKWYSEKQFKNLMALNRKEESLLQKKLEQLHREESLLQREYNSKIVKTAKALNAHETSWNTGTKREVEARFNSRRKSLPSTEPNKEAILRRRRHSIACSPSAANIMASQRENKLAANNDVMSTIENNFNFL